MENWSVGGHKEREGEGERGGETTSVSEAKAGSFSTLDGEPPGHSGRGWVEVHRVALPS